MKQQINEIEISAAAEIAAAADTQSLEAVRIKYLGKKGALTAILRGMGSLTPEERPVIGAYANTVRGKIEEEISARSESLKSASLASALENEKLDITMPARKKPLGRLHPITQVENRMKEIFVGLGFDIVEGPEVESAYNNFDALNAPADHPSRDRSDTFYITDDILLRTQTSPVQIRAMQGKQPPIRIISPGRVYRCDEVDAIPRCSTSSRDWLSIRTSLSATLRVCSSSGRRQCSARTPRRVSVPITSRSPSRPPRLTCPASYAAARAAACARARAGSSCSEPDWYIRTCLPAAGSIRRYTADSRSVSALSAW